MPSEVCISRYGAAASRTRLAQRPHHTRSGRACEPDRGGIGMFKNMIIFGGGVAGTKNPPILGHTVPARSSPKVVKQEKFLTLKTLLPRGVGGAIIPRSP